MKIVPLQVDKEYVEGAGVVLGAMGSHDSIKLRVTFSEDWEDLSKYATFRDAKGYNPKVVVIWDTNLVEDTESTYDITVPIECMAYQGRASITFTGFKIVNGSEESSAFNTATAFVRVLPSDYSLADDGSVTATLAQQLQTQINIMSSEQGTGIPQGGTTGQVLSKKTDASYDAEWVTGLTSDGNKIYKGSTQLYPETKVENITNASGTGLSSVISGAVIDGKNWTNVASGQKIPATAKDVIFVLLNTTTNVSYGYECIFVPAYMIFNGMFAAGLVKTVYYPSDNTYYGAFTIVVQSDGTFTFSASSNNQYFGPTVLCLCR